MTFNLLTVMGKVKTDSVQATCQLHNQTAGNPDGVIAAKSLGDMSHLAFMPLDTTTSFSGDLLFLDIWNNLEGLNQFFSDDQVKAGGEMMFASRTAIVWAKLENFTNFHFPSPFGKNDRIVGLIQGKVKSISEAEGIHNQAMASQVKAARAHGLISHEFHVRKAAPGSEESMEVLGIDVWMDADDMMKYYKSSEFQNSGLYQIFATKPVSSLWINPQGDWIEW